MFKFRKKRSSLAKTIYQAEYKKAYLEQMKEEAAKEGKEAAQAESKKQQGESLMKKTENFLAAGARVSEALVGSGPPQQNDDKRRRLL